MPINEYINDALRSGKTPEELAAELNEALKLAEAALREEEAKAAEAAKITARNDALKDIVENTLTWFDNFAPEANLREIIDPNIDYNELAEMLVELAASIQQLSVLTHVMPKPQTKKKTIKGQKSMSDDEALKIFLSSLGI